MLVDRELEIEQLKEQLRGVSSGGLAVPRQVESIITPRVETAPRPMHVPVCAPSSEVRETVPGHVSARSESREITSTSVTTSTPRRVIVPRHVSAGTTSSEVRETVSGGVSMGSESSGTTSRHVPVSTPGSSRESEINTSRSRPTSAEVRGVGEHVPTSASPTEARETASETVPCSITPRETRETSRELTGSRSVDTVRARSEQERELPREVRTTLPAGPRKGKAPPIEPYTGENVELHFEEWLITLNRAADWNQWNDEERLMQLAGYLRGRALLEWTLLEESDRSSWASAQAALRSRLDPATKVLAAQHL